jgi:hypothetical protein
MVKGRDAHFEEWLHLFFSEHGPAAPAMVAAAEAGFQTAQFMLGMAHLRGDGVEQDNRSAYHWLRLAAVSSTRVVEESRGAINELTSRLESKDIHELEKQISAETHARPIAKLNREKQQAHVALSHFAKAAS